MIDQLIEAIIEKNNPSVVGIDTDFSYLPEAMRQSCASLEDAAKAVLEFNVRLIDAIAPVVPGVKVQVAYYESLGWAGMRTFADTLAYAKDKGLFTIADVKRNDIGSTASAYAKGYFSGSEINGKTFVGFDSDFVTVNGYLGADGVVPFVKDCVKCDRGIFVLVKTSNPSSDQLQDLKVEDGKTVYAKMGELVETFGQDTIGRYGYSAVGAVVGATHPKQAEALRASMPHTFFLIPGYGAQGGTAEDLKVCFDQRGLGGIVNSSRGILCAYRNKRYEGMAFDAAAAAASEDMREDLARVINMRG